MKSLYGGTPWWNFSFLEHQLGIVKVTVKKTFKQYDVKKMQQEKQCNEFYTAPMNFRP